MTRTLYDLGAVIFIGACILAGIILSFTSKKIDSPVEQTLEAILATEGIDVDFSAWKKAEEDEDQ